MRSIDIAALLGRKIIKVVPVLAAVSILTFLFMSLLPGDATTAILGNAASVETREALRAELGLDRPLPERYADWVTSALQGDLGRSLRNHEPVTEAIAGRLPVTLELVVLSQLLAVVVAIPVAVWSAFRPGRLLDQLATFGAFAAIALPSFILAVILGYVFAYRLAWFPTSGYVPFRDDPAGNLHRMVLPVVSLAAGSAAVYLRLLRGEMLRTLEQDFVLVAEAKGLSTRRILLVHALKPSSFPLVTVVGLTLGNLIGGALIIEIVFGLPGIGRLMYDAVLARDYVVVQGAVGLIAAGYVVMNLLVDISYSLIDPRVRHDG